MRVFISYSSKDEQFANKLSKTLTENNIYIWKDSYQMQRGACLSSEILKGIEKCTNMIVILSKDYVGKLSQNDSYCKIEFDSATEEQQKNKDFIIPVVLEECCIPNILKDMLFIDFRNSYNEGINQLSESLYKFLDNSAHIENEDYIRDLAMAWGIESFDVKNIGMFVLNIDSISSEKGEKYSILAQFKIIGDKRFTNLYLRHLRENKEYLLDNIIHNLYDELQPTTGKSSIMLDTAGCKEVSSSLCMNGCTLKYTVYINRLGEIPNRVAKFNYGSIIEGIYDFMQVRYR